MTRGSMLRIKLAVIALSFSAIGFATPKSLDLGGLVLSVSDAPTAQIFHIVDQLSQWDVYTHKQGFIAKFGKWEGRGSAELRSGAGS